MGIKVWNRHKKVSSQERQVQEDMERNLKDDDANRREEYWEGDTVRNVVDVYEAYLRIDGQQEKMDILSIFCEESSSYNRDKKTIQVGRTVGEVLELEAVRNNEHFAKYAEREDELYLELWFSDEAVKCVAPKLSPDEAVTLKDVWTTFPPRYVLQYIQKRVIELGGTGSIDLRTATMGAHLATHNFPAPVTIQVRIFEDEERGCFLVKFERLGGDTLHFGRVLRQLVRKCGHCLTGVPKAQFKCSDEDRQEAEKLFGDGQQQQLQAQQ